MFQAPRRQRRRSLPAFPGFIILLLILVGCGTTSTASTPTTSANNTSGSNNYGLAALSGYQVSLFASGTASGAASIAPDSVIVDSGHVFIDYQNSTAKDCTDKNSSTVIEYTMDGKVVKTFSIPGHSDGMRADPSTHLIWTTSCEDGNAKLATIDPASGTITPYTFPNAPHGGGYDDLYFLNGMTFIAASAPTLDSSGNNTAPALDQITLSNGKAVLKPILMGNATATDTTTSPPSKVTLNLTDPDSLSTDGKGDLVLVSQGDSELIVISNPGTAQQSVSRIPVGTQLDDTVWATSAHGRLLVTDGPSGNTYWIRPTSISTGTIFTELPSDSGVANAVAVVDPATGIVTPVIIGFSSPTGMLFVPD